MLENCKRLICSHSLNKVYCIVLYRIVDNVGLVALQFFFLLEAKI